MAAGSEAGKRSLCGRRSGGRGTSGGRAPSYPLPSALGSARSPPMSGSGERSGRLEARADGRASAATLADVARLAGVSPATASRVLNGNERVGAAYRERVLQTISEVGYRPNRLARNLRKQRSAAIGVVVPDITNAHFTEMIRVIEGEAFAQDLNVLVCATDETAAKQARYLSMLAEERVAGVILSVADPGGEEIGRLIDEQIPLVAFDRDVDDARADSVIADNVGAARTATERLLQSGYRDIVLVSGRAEVERDPSAASASSRRCARRASSRARSTGSSRPSAPGKPWPG